MLLFFLQKCCNFHMTMCPKKGRRVRKIEVPTDSVQLGNTAVDIQQRRQEREAREGEEAQPQKQRGGGKEEGGKSGGITLSRGGSCRKKAQDGKKLH